MSWIPNWLRRTPAPDAVLPATQPDREPLVANAPVPDQEPAVTPPTGAPQARPALADAEALEGRIRERLERVTHQLERAFPGDRAGDGTADLRRSVLSLDPRVIRRPPPAAQAGLEAAGDPDTPVEKLVAIFEHDPSLAQDLLRHSNSIHYSSHGIPSRSLRDAVQRVGSGGAQEVLLAATVRGMLCRPGGEYQAMVDRVWTHMVRTGPLSRAIATRFGAEPDHAFLVGLLHDVGKLVVFDRITEMRSARRGRVTLAPAFLSRLLRTTHAPVGAAMALRWNLGVPTARAILDHHRPEGCDPGDALSATVCVAEAADLAVACGWEADAEALWNRAALPGSPDRFVEILERARSLAADEPGSRRAA